MTSIVVIKDANGHITDSNQKIETTVPTPLIRIKVDSNNHIKSVNSHITLTTSNPGLDNDDIVDGGVF
jgi:hypothetical protein